MAIITDGCQLQTQAKQVTDSLDTALAELRQLFSPGSDSALVRSANSTKQLTAAEALNGDLKSRTLSQLDMGGTYMQTMQGGGFCRTSAEVSLLVQSLIGGKDVTSLESYKSEAPVVVATSLAAGSTFAQARSSGTPISVDTGQRDKGYHIGKLTALLGPTIGVLSDPRQSDTNKTRAVADFQTIIDQYVAGGIEELRNGANSTKDKLATVEFVRQFVNEMKPLQAVFIFSQSANADTAFGQSIGNVASSIIDRIADFRASAAAVAGGAQ